MGCCVTRETLSTQNESGDLISVTKGNTLPATPKSSQLTHHLYTPQARTQSFQFPLTHDDKLPSPSELVTSSHISESPNPIEHHISPIYSPLETPYSHNQPRHIDYSSEDSSKTSSNHSHSGKEEEKSLEVSSPVISDIGYLRNSSDSSSKEEVEFPVLPQTEIPFRTLLEENTSPRSETRETIIPREEETPGDLLKYGDVIILTHKNTWNSLHSHKHHYMSGSMGQQVVCLSDRTDNDQWKICRPYQPNGEEDTQREVKYGSMLRLKHKATKTYLTSQLGVSSPYSSQQEVSSDKESSDNQNWILEPSEEFSTEEWSSDHDMKLKHVATGMYLQSGEIHFNLGHGNLQEVFGSDKLEGDEIWLIELKHS